MVVAGMAAGNSTSQIAVANLGVVADPAVVRSALAARVLLIGVGLQTPVVDAGIETNVGQRTIVAAVVVVVLIAIIAGFDTCLDMPITARGCRAIIETGIGLRLVGIIAGFDARLNMTIATTRSRAVV